MHIEDYSELHFDEKNKAELLMVLCNHMGFNPPVNKLTKSLVHLKNIVENDIDLIHNSNVFVHITQNSIKEIEDNIKSLTQKIGIFEGLSQAILNKKNFGGLVESQSIFAYTNVIQAYFNLISPTKEVDIDVISPNEFRLILIDNKDNYTCLLTVTITVDDEQSIVPLNWYLEAVFHRFYRESGRLILKYKSSKDDSGFNKELTESARRMVVGVGKHFKARTNLKIQHKKDTNNE